MRAHLRYAWYVAKHKWFVFIACCQLGIPWRGIIHDLCKFLPCEWVPYANYFYGDWDNDRIGQAAFNAAWLHHQHHSPHHWQYWVLRNDDGYTRYLDMPMHYRKEMLADWRGAGRALGKPDTRAWYLHNRERILLHPDTRRWIEDALGIPEGSDT